MSNPLVTVSIMAKLFNLTERRIQQLARDGIIPKPEKGKYDLIACVQAYIKYLQDRATGRGDIEPQDMYAERARLLKAQADKTEMEVKALNGEVIAAEQVEMLWSGLVSAFRARMLALPVRCAQLVMPMKVYTDVEACLRAQVYEALNELSQHDPEQRDDAISFSESAIDLEPESGIEPQHSGGDIEKGGEPGRAAAAAEDQSMVGQLSLLE